MASLGMRVQCVISIILGRIDRFHDGRSDSLQTLWAKMNAIICAKVDSLSFFIRHETDVWLIQAPNQ